MKRYVLVGTGHRAHEMFIRPIKQDFDGRADIVGIYDINPIRAAYIAKKFGIRQFGSFDEMLDAIRPDGVIVTTRDCNHHEYVLRALRKGYDVLCEKPVTNTPQKCFDIAKAERETGKKVTVTFNCRFMPLYSAVKRLVADNRIGRVLSVNYEYMVGEWHGADYFRRWHRRMENSGGMLIHKATHHFDIANWIIGDTPIAVSAVGNRIRFGDAGVSLGRRCSVCAGKSRCPYFWPIENDAEMGDFYEKLYLDAESADGYVRDACVFDREIDIYDQMSVNVRYKNGAILTYSLILTSPYEGYKLTVTGETGRIEAHESDRETDRDYLVKVFDRRGGEEITVARNIGAHGGGDQLLRETIFMDGKDDLGRKATLADGIITVLTGWAANQSIAERRTVSIPDICKKFQDREG